MPNFEPPVPTNSILSRVLVEAVYDGYGVGGYKIFDVETGEHRRVRSRGTVEGPAYYLKGLLLRQEHDRWLVRFDDGQSVWVREDDSRKI